MVTTEQQILTAGDPVQSLEDYRKRGGLEAIDRAAAMDPEEVIAAIRRANLRGRGGAGFPTARKWQGVRDSRSRRKFAVCNAAEGEPGTFKDRWLLRHNPYQTLEGLAIAARVVGAERAFICMKRNFEQEVARVHSALHELRAETDWADAIELIEGPDEYLFGEEKAMLEVIEGGLPLPRVFPPYLHGLFASAYAGPSDQENNPTLVNNVETLAHATHIVRNGPDWFRSLGTEDTPGTMVFTVSGDVRAPAVRELPLGLTLRQLIDEVGGGVGEGRSVKAVFPGVANAVITPDLLETPLGFDSMRRAGSALGSAGFVVYDDTACMAQVAWIYSRFLYVESCDQCAPCKLGSGEITDRLEHLLEGKAEDRHLEEVAEMTTWVTNGQRCYLPTSGSLVISSLIELYSDDFIAHLRGGCKLRHDITLPKFVDYVEGEGFTYDLRQAKKQPDWTYEN
jgi:NADH:ubiquinone oxidoreductase subunit F (NADH-binding)